MKNEFACVFTDKLKDYFLLQVEMPRIKVENKQEIETLI
jgi:hypothetical protein